MSMSNSGLSPTTITSKMSALNYMFKLFKLADPSQDFWVKSFLSGLRKCNPQTDTRVPILLDTLQSMIAMLSKLCLNSYDLRLYKVMFSMAFHAFLRPGEMTGLINNLQLDHCRLLKKCIILTFFKYKHHKGPPYTIKVCETKSSDCPVYLLRKFLKYRRSKPGPLFCLKNGKHVTYSRFAKIFHCVISSININGKFSPHSFRIGAASWAAMNGASDDEIRRMGRWSNNSVLKYIRIPTISLKKM